MGSMGFGRTERVLIPPKQPYRTVPYRTVRYSTFATERGRTLGFCRAMRVTRCLFGICAPHRGELHSKYCSIRKFSRRLLGIRICSSFFSEGTLHRPKFGGATRALLVAGFYSNQLLIRCCQGICDCIGFPSNSAATVINQ